MLYTSRGRKGGSHAAVVATRRSIADKVIHEGTLVSGALPGDGAVGTPSELGAVEGAAAAADGVTSLLVGVARLLVGMASFVVGVA